MAFLVALMIALSLACAPRAWAAGNDESGQLVAQAMNGVALGEVSSFDNISSDGYVVISEKNDNIFAMTATINGNDDGLKGTEVGSSDDGKYSFADLDTCRWYVEKLESGGLYVLRCSKGYLKCSEDDYLGFGFVFSLENSATDATPISIGTSGELLIGESALKLKYNNNGDFVVDEDGGSSADKARSNRVPVLEVKWLQRRQRTVEVTCAWSLSFCYYCFVRAKILFSLH